jgi:hypothetical protein
MKGKSIRTEWFHHYASTNGAAVIRVRTRRTPSEKSRPRSGTWVVRVLMDNGKWEMPPCPEVTWNTLRRMIYLGRTSQ